MPAALVQLAVACMRERKRKEGYVGGEGGREINRWE
jgi:hypothetical protein